MPTPTVEYDLKELLTNIDSKLDKLDNKVDTSFKELKDEIKSLEIGQIELKGEITNIKTTLTQVQKDVADLKGTQNKQAWVLIGVVAGAILKFTFAPNWHF